MPAEQTCVPAVRTIRLRLAPEANQALATLRNLAILRLAGFQSITSALRWMAWDYRRSFQLLGL